MRALGPFACAVMTAIVLIPDLAAARGDFRGRVPRMNLGGGGDGAHAHAHAHAGRSFNPPSHAQHRYHPEHHGRRPVHPDQHRAGHHPHPPVPPHPPGPGPHPPGPGPHPHPPGPHPGPHPHPHPHPPPPPPPPGPYWPGYWGRAAAWGAATAVTAVAVGTVIASLPADCVNVVVNGITYRDCNGNWFEPRYDGHTVVYVAVSDPR